MAFDYKKEYKEYYMPKCKPEIVDVPPMNYIAVRGKGDPNEEGGTYQQAISVLYAVAYTLKMSYKTEYKIKGFFEYVVPPLEGFWWQDDVDGVNYADKSGFNWISVIRLPGVTIGNNTIIGAGSVVNKNIPDGVIAAGNPCKVIRKITDSDKTKYPIFEESH